MSRILKVIPADQAPKGAKRKLVGVIVEYISIVDAGANMREFIAKAEISPEHDGMVAFEKQVRIVKFDEEQKRVMGVVYTPDETDAHGEYMDRATVEAMAADFLRGGRTNNVDKQHNFIPGEGYVMESYLIKDGGDPEFPGEKPGAWVVTIQVTNDSTWNKIKSGELKALSLAGYAMVEDVEVVEEEDKDISKTVVPYSATSKMDEGTSWDGGAARKSLESWATDSDGNIDWAKYRKGFAWYDGDAADTKGAYKLPHHQIVDGTLKVNLKGTQAAMGALLGARGGTNIPDGERKGVYNHLAKHYKQYDKEVPEFKSLELAWDEGGAVRRIETWATTGNTIDFTLYSEGFAATDPNEHLDSIKAYQYPHHDVVAGELIVSPRGVRDAVRKVISDLGEGRLLAGQADEALGHLGLHLTESGESILDATGPEELAPKSLGTFLEKLSLPFVRLPKGISKAEALLGIEEQARRKTMQEVIKAAGTQYSFEASLKQNFGFVLGYVDLIFLLWYVLDNIFYSTELTLAEKQAALTTSVTAFLNVLQAFLVQAYSLTLSGNGEGIKSLIEVTLAMLEKDGKVTLTKEELEEKLAAARKEGGETALKAAEKTSDVTLKDPLVEDDKTKDVVTKEISGINGKLDTLTATVEKVVETVTGLVDRVKTVEEARGISKAGDPDNRKDGKEPPYQLVGVGKSLRDNLKKGKD